MTTITRPQEEVNTNGDGLLERYQPLVRKTAARWAYYHPDRREDIAQEVAVALWQVLCQRPDAPLNYLTVVANNTASKYLSRGTSIDRPFELKRRQRWLMVSLDVVTINEDGGEETVDSDKVRRHQRPCEWKSPVEDIVVARFLYLDLHGRLSRLERAVLRARLQGYRVFDMPELLGLEYEQLRNAAHRVQKKARRIWNEKTDQACPPAPGKVQGRFF